MMIALAAAQADFTQFEWVANTGPEFKLQLGEHKPIPVDTDDLIGLRKATRGPTAGSFQVVLAKYPQLIFRSVPQEAVDKFVKHTKPYQGIPEKPKKSGKYQDRLIVDRLIDNHDKLSAQFFVPKKSPREVGSYDKNDYQWRKVVRHVTVHAKTSKSARATLREHDVIGVRYLRKSHGGYVIVPSGERIMIDHDMYEAITVNTDILPKSKQETGEIDLNDVLASLPKGTRMRIPRKPTEPKKPKAEKLPKIAVDRPFVDANKPLVSEYDYKDFDTTFDFDEDEEDEVLNPPTDFDDDVDDETVNTQGNPEEDLAEFDPDEEEDDPEMDHQLDDEHDEETGEVLDDPDAVYPEEGLVLKTRDGKEWVIAGMEESGMSNILLMYSPDTKELRHYKVPIGEDLRNMKTITPDRIISGPAFEKIRDEAAERDLSAGKRL